MNDEAKIETEFSPLYMVKKAKFHPICDSLPFMTSMGWDQNYLYQIIEAMPINIYWKDLAGRYLGCNKRVLQLAGLDSLTDFIGKTDFDLPWANEAPKLQKIDFRVIRFKKNINIRDIVVLKGRKYYYFTSRYPLLDSNQEVIGVIGLSLNITAQVQAEKKTRRAQQNEREANKKVVLEKEFRESTVILAGSIAHDIKNPLSSMHIYSDLMNNALQKLGANIDMADPAKQQMTEMHDLVSQIRSLNTKIRKNMDDMNAFINTTMRSISRLLTDSLTEEDFAPCEIELCLLDVVHRYPFMPNEKELIHLNVMHNFQFLGSPVLIYRVIANLVNNALRQIHLQKRGEIYITTEEISTHNLVKIKDTAGNVAADKINNIFCTYKNKSQQNTGIGLKFCKLTMQSFGGDITCDIMDGGHIEFTLHFVKI
ncbi:MAG: PAS domain-containing sensor histidine kinase [Gammaproteobacteria bacterium]|nr:PAS domain-containing sensor histidine kinase [Gammaproteobacteria bacterium]